MLQCATWHCDKPQQHHSRALCQATPHPTTLCPAKPRPKPPCCATICQTPWQGQPCQATLCTMMQDSAVPSHTRAHTLVPHGTMQCPAVLPSTATHHTVPCSTPQASPCESTKGAAGPPPHHEGLVDRVTELEDVVADSQVVLQAERLQHHAVPHREGQSQLLAGGRSCGTPPLGKPTPSPRAPATPLTPPLHKDPLCRKPNLHYTALPTPETAAPCRKLLPPKAAPPPWGHPTPTPMEEAHPTEDSSRSLQETTPYPSPSQSRWPHPKRSPLPNQRS